MIIGAPLSGSCSINALNFLYHRFSRSIFDNNEHQDFKRKLEERVKHHDKDIERLCNVYYQGFIESVTELLEVKSQSKNLNVSAAVVLRVWV